MPDTDAPAGQASASGRAAPSAPLTPVPDAATDAATDAVAGSPWAQLPSSGRARTSLLRAAVRPQMLVLLVLLLGAAAVCARLGVWQLDRAEIRGGSEEVERAAEMERAAPVGLGEVLAPQTTFDGVLIGRRVEVRGTYEPDGQLLVVDRALDGVTGYLVLTPMRVTDDSPGSAQAAGSGSDPQGGPVLPVVRGWVATAEEASAVAPPTGEVTVTGYLQASEGSTTSALPAGQTDAISSAALLHPWGGPIYTGYVVLTGSDPAQDAGLALLPAPTREGTGLNVQNLAYAAQWWIFGGFALFLWVRVVRDEARGDGVPVDPTAPPSPPSPSPPETQSSPQLRSV